MKSLVLILASALVALSLSSQPASSATQEAPTLAPQDDLEKRVAELESLVGSLRRENEETTHQLEQTLTYLNAQADAARQLLGTLDRSEQLGFTKGINFESREVLLAGFRSYWGGAAKDLPKPAAKKKQDGAPRR